MGSSRPRTPSSTSVIVATAVMGLVSEAIRKMASRWSGASSSKDGVPTASTSTSSPQATKVTSPGRRPAATWAAIESCRRARPCLERWVVRPMCLFDVKPSANSSTAWARGIKELRRNAENIGNSWIGES